MRCPRCSHENPDSHKFCAECGSELVVVCPSCATANPPASKFCGACGTSLQEDPRPTPAPERAQRRLVSVLFADLVGFTPFSEARDPEDVRGLLTTYFDRSSEIVERFGGAVDKFIGDAVMAVWGAVESQEDDAERSVRAALDLVDMVAALGEEIGVPELALRAGVMSGETSVGPGGNEKGLVVGDLVNTASRLQSIAPPGGVLVGEPTRALTSGSISYEPTGPQTVKGKEVPVPAFRAMHVVSEVGGARRSGGVEPPFTGRDVEFRMLKDQFHASGRDGAARLVSVVGEAGIGKTRLSWELEKYTDGLADVVYWHRGRSPSYGDGLTLWALGEMVRRRAGIAETDDPGKSRLKLRTAVAEYVGSEEDRRWLEPRLAALLGLEAAPAGDREEMYSAIRTFFHSVAERGPVVLVFEDMHWADPDLVDFVVELVERSPRHPIFVLSLARPELLERHPGFGSGRNSVSLRLPPLSDAAMSELVTAMLPAIAADAMATLVERAGGIPLYAVEFARMLAAGEADVADPAAAVGDLPLPETLQAVVGARLDRLSSIEREVLQDAAVLGQAFTAHGLSIVRELSVPAAVDELANLVRLQILEIEDDPRAPERGQYRFVQSVIREVAYGRLSRADRYSRHLRVAAYFEGLDDPELIGAVASHYLAAGEAAPDDEADALLARGRTALSDAAGRAAGLGIHDAALSLLKQAMELSPSPRDRAPLVEQAASSALWTNRYEESVGFATEAEGLYGDLGDDDGVLRAVTLRARLLSNVFRPDDAAVLLAPYYEAMDDPDTVAEVSLALEFARARMMTDDHAGAVEIGDQVMARAERLLSPAEIVEGLITRATSLGQQGRMMEGLSLLIGAVAVADDNDLQMEAVRATNNLVVLRQFDSLASGTEYAEDLLGRARRLGSAAWMARALLSTAQTHAGAGDLERADELLDETVSYHLVEVEEEFRDLARGWITAMRTTGAEEIEHLKQVAARWEDSDAPQLTGAASSTKSFVAFLESDFESALEFSLGDLSPAGGLTAVYAAVFLQDLDSIERARGHLDALGADGRVIQLGRLVLDAGDAIVRGDRSLAVRRFREAIDLGERVLNPFLLRGLLVLFGGLMGDDHPEARAAGLRAPEWARERGLVRMEKIWSEWLSDQQSSAAESA